MYLDEFEGIIYEVMAAQLGEIPEAKEVQREIVSNMVRSEGVTTMVSTSLLLFVMAIFGVLEFLKSAVFCPVAGIITSLARYFH
jgi:hypothetical protein